MSVNGPTTCVITEICDQPGHGNNLTDAPGGGAAGGPDNLANATAAPVTVGGHEAYGVYVAPGTGYRDDSTSGIATGDSPEGEYAIFDGTHVNNGCCFDYGNAETNNDDNGAGHTAMVEGESNQWATLDGNAQSGGLTIDFSGVRPSGYNPMHKEGRSSSASAATTARVPPAPSTKA